MLIVGILLLLLLPRLYELFFREEYNRLALEKDQEVLNHLIASFDSMSAQQPDVVASFPQPFKFDPNAADQLSLEQLGIPSLVASRVVKYRQKGGVFRVKKDLLKIYDFPRNIYRHIQEFIDLPDHEVPQQESRRAKVNHTKIIQPFDLNQADTSQLSQLAGIGSVLSGRIVKFRDALGGFYAVNQVKEVYHINETALEQLGKYAFITENFVPERLNINKADVRELSRHPYVSYDLAKAIVNHREVYGAFTSLEELKEVHLMDDKLPEKLLFYLSI